MFCFLLYAHGGVSYVYVDLDWSLLSGINNVVGGVDATIIANVDVEAAVSASKSASKSIDLVPPVCIPYICYGATIMGIGATVGATAGVSFDTSFNFDGSLSVCFVCLASPCMNGPWCCSVK